MDYWKITATNSALFNQILKNIQDSSQPNIENDFQMIFANRYAQEEKKTENATKKDVIDLMSDSEYSLEISIQESPEASHNSLELTYITDNPSPKPKFYDFTKYLLDTLEVDEMLLNSDDINQLNETPSDDLKIIFSTLQPKLSIDAIYNFCTSICTEVHNHSKLVASLCTNIILPKFLECECNRRGELALSTLAEKYPSTICDNLLVPLIISQSCPNIKIINSVIKTLQVEDRMHFMRRFLESCQLLEDHHLPIVHNFFSSHTDASFKRALVELMIRSTPKYNNDKTFTQLLMVVLQSLGPEFQDLGNVLKDVVDQNQTIFKRSLKKVFEAKLLVS